MIDNNHAETFYWDPKMQERVRVTCRVRLLEERYYDGYVEVEAESEEEAVELEKDVHHGDVDWECFDMGDYSEAMDVEKGNLGLRPEYHWSGLPQFE
jgi:hypothetical protein